MRRSRSESAAAFAERERVRRLLAREARPVVKQPPVARTRPLSPTAALPLHHRRLRWRPALRAGTAPSRCFQRGGEEPLCRQRGGDRGRAECDRSSRGCERGAGSRREGEAGAERDGREPGCGDWHERGIDPSPVDREPGGERVGRGGGAATSRRNARTAQRHLASRGLGGWQGLGDQGRGDSAGILAAASSLRCLKGGHGQDVARRYGEVKSDTRGCVGMRFDSARIVLASASYRTCSPNARHRVRSVASARPALSWRRKSPAILE